MKPKDNSKLQDSSHKSHLQHHEHRPSIHTKLKNQTTTIEHEPLFDILDDDTEDEPKEDVPEDHQA